MSCVSITWRTTTWPGDGIPTLKFPSWAPALFNESVSLVQGIENLQLEYGLDTDANGDADVYTANPDLYLACNGTTTPTCVGHWTSVVSTKVFLLSRSVDPSPGHNGHQHIRAGTEGRRRPERVHAGSGRATSARSSRKSSDCRIRAAESDTMKRQGQRGITLIISLIMLVLLTIMALTSFNIGKSSLQVIDNAQQQGQVLNAAQTMFNQVVSSPNFAEAPNNVLDNSNCPPALAAPANSRCMDLYGDAKTVIVVAMQPQPACLQATPILASGLNLSNINSEDWGCTLRDRQDHGIEGIDVGRIALRQQLVGTQCRGQGTGIRRRLWSRRAWRCASRKTPSTRPVRRLEILQEQFRGRKATMFTIPSNAAGNTWAVCWRLRRHLRGPAHMPRTSTCSRQSAGEQAALPTS